MRQINYKLILWKTLLYRLLIVGIQIMFTYGCTKNWNLSVRIGIYWNILNVTLYYIYDILFLSFKKVGRQNV